MNFVNKKQTTIKKLLHLICILFFYTASLQGQCEFTISELNPCSGNTIEFYTISNDPGFAWDFNNDGKYC